MAHEIRLHVGGQRFLPPRERAHGHVLLHRGDGPPTHALSRDRRAGVGRSIRSRVAALAASTRVRTVTSNVRWP